MKKSKARFNSPRSRLINELFQMKKAMDEIDAERKLSPAPTKLFIQPAHKDAALKLLADAAKPDLVNHPPHYKAGGIDYWDFAEAQGLTENAYLFNAGKYIVRCGKKEGADPIQDLEKAIKFIQRDIDRRKKA